MRANHADGEHRVVEDAIVAPLLKRFFLRFGKAEVGLSAPKLTHAVVFVGLEQLAGADEPEGIVAFGAERVLAALAAGEREQSDAHAHSARQIGHQRAVFIVGMGHDEKYAGRGAEPLEGLFEIGSAAVFGQWERVRRGLGQRNLGKLGGGGGGRLILRVERGAA